MLKPLYATELLEEELKSVLIRSQYWLQNALKFKFLAGNELRKSILKAVCNLCVLFLKLLQY